jgi:hypothetical protein
MIVLTKAETFQEKYDDFEIKRKERAAAKKSAEQSPKAEPEAIA